MVGRVEQEPSVERGGGHRHGVWRALDDGAFVLLAAGVLALAGVLRLLRALAGPREP